jgi:hypothetical protein
MLKAAMAAVVVLAAALLVLPLLGEGPEYAEAEAQMRESFRTSDHFVCAGYGFHDAGAMIDLPAYYFRAESGELVSVCGGACMGPSSRRQQMVCQTLCPPAEWSAAGCDEKYNAWLANKSRGRSPN